MTPIEPSRREHSRIVLGYGGRNELCARATKQIYLQNITSARPCVFAPAMLHTVIKTFSNNSYNRRIQLFLNNDLMIHSG